jgi:hypothetical protein
MAHQAGLSDATIHRNAQRAQGVRDQSGSLGLSKTQFWAAVDTPTELNQYWFKRFCFFQD